MIWLGVRFTHPNHPPQPPRNSNFKHGIFSKRFELEDGNFIWCFLMTWQPRFNSRKKIGAPYPPTVFTFLAWESISFCTIFQRQGPMYATLITLVEISAWLAAYRATCCVIGSNHHCQVMYDRASGEIVVLVCWDRKNLVCILYKIKEDEKDRKNWNFLEDGDILQQHYGKTKLTNLLKGHRK